MDFRKTFDQIPKTFEKYRPRYCNELFKELISSYKIDESKNVLEI